MIPPRPRITTNGLAALVLLAPVTAAVLPSPVKQHRADPADDVEERIAACKDDVGKLLELAEEYRDSSRADAARAVFERILEIDPDHGGAHLGLGHHLYEGKWFESYSALSAHKRAEAKRMLADHGLVRFGDDWVPQADLPFLRMDWIRDESGRFRSKREIERLAREKRYTAEGWRQQADLVWVPPDEVGNWDEGLWKCGEQWLSTEEANAYHAQLERWWTVPGEHFVALTTLEFEQGRWAAWWADQTYPDLLRLFGIHPPEKPRVVVLDSSAQYNAFAAGDQASGRDATENSGESSVHYAFFADIWFDTTSEPSEFLGTGVGFWEPGDARLANYGTHSVRWAAGQAYAEAIDPSWNTISLFVASDVPFDGEGFWKEKHIPRWLRYGACSYVERYFVDRSVGDGEDSLWARNWALGNLRQRGGLRPLEQLFALEIDTTDVPGSERLLSEAGCVVAFVLDGGCKPVARAHQAFKSALRKGEGTGTADLALRKAIVEHEAELKAFAGL